MAGAVQFNPEAVSGKPAGKLAFGRSPMWRQPAFIDAFADAFIPKGYGGEARQRLRTPFLRLSLRFDGVVFVCRAVRRAIRGTSSKRTK